MSSIPERSQRMTSVILKMSVSLDGYIAPADGSSGWEAAGRSPDGADWVLDTVSNAGAHLVGAVTYALGPLLARRIGAIRGANERDPQDRVLELDHVGRLGR